MFTFYACNDPVGWADNVSALKRVDPAVVVHNVATLLTGAITAVVRTAVVANDVSLPAIRFALQGIERAQYAVLKTIVNLAVVKWVVAILKPLCGLNHHRFFSKFHFYFLSSASFARICSGMGAAFFLSASIFANAGSTNGLTKVSGISAPSHRC